MISPARNLFGIGVYTPDEAARYARVTTRTMNRWVFGEGESLPVIRSQLAISDEPAKLVTFLDFVQILAVRQVRLREKKFPLQRIRAACDVAADRYRLDYPLAARDHRIYLFGPKDNLKLCEMVIEVGQNSEGHERLVQLSGRKSGNVVMNEIAEPFMSRLQFGESTFAESYVAWEKDGRKILMHPHKRLGEPFLPSCGYTALALWEAHVAEGSVENAAEAYGVEKADVDLACEYFDYLTGRDAA